MAELADLADLQINVPQQRRSRASLYRMLQAAEDVMIRLGGDEFTLVDVSKAGHVSIGSIYLRFSTKEMLVRAVMARILERVARDEESMINDLLKNSNNLGELVVNCVDDYANLLQRHAPQMRLCMDRAEHDPLVSRPGKAQANRAASGVAAAIMAFECEISGKRKQVKAETTARLLFSALARELGLGSTRESAHPQDWSVFKAELAQVCLAYLRHAP